MKKMALILIALVCVSSSTHAQSIPEATCKEFPSSIFKPCICDFRVPKSIKYRPSYRACGGNAAAILGRQFANSYSVVLRDSQNRDRWPAVGYNGCSQEEADEGLSKCSAFKCQRKFRDSKRRLVCCFGEPGSNPIMAGATRMTIKLRDDPTSTNDPLLRVCLNGFDPDVPLN